MLESFERYAKPARYLDFYAVKTTNEKIQMQFSKRWKDIRIVAHSRIDNVRKYIHTIQFEQFFLAKSCLSRSLYSSN